MDGPPPTVDTAMPTQIKFILAIVYFQVLANLAGAVLVFAVINNRSAHPQAVPPVAALALVLSVLVGLGLLACAITLPRLRARIRTTLLVLEAIMILTSLYNIANGATASAIGMGLAVGVVVQLLKPKPKVADWLHL